ncbi:MAG: archaellin/type IV pilin N-terminal domain-containing protein [archaeon]
MNFPLGNRRGITPIISVILLLMMTIAIAGLAYTWLQGLQTTIEESTENTTTRMLGEMNVELRLDGASGSPISGSGYCNATVYVRNKGTERADNLQLYVNDLMVVGGNITSLSPGSTVSWAYVNSSTLNVTNNTFHKFKIVSDETEASESIKVLC